MATSRWFQARCLTWATRESGGAGVGSLAALTFLALVFLAGVYVGAHTTLAWLAGR